jgi:hypothetical protein
VTQLLKRHRDVIYKEDKDAPPSIVLTTMAAHNHNGAVNTTDALGTVLTGIRSDLSLPGPLIIINPSNPTENLVDGWAPERRKKFATFIDNFKGKIDHLLQQQGLDKITAGLEELFGTEIATKAIKAYAQRIEEQRRAGNMRAGMIGAGLTVRVPHTVPIRRNENFGE